MLRIRTMRPEDIAFAIKLSGQEKWGIPRADFERILRLDPRSSFIACDGRVKVGLTTTTSYGRKLAWIGNVVVHRDHRGKHIGRKLVQHAVAYLCKSRVEHIALYCFTENTKFYQNLGFVKDAPFVRLRRKAKPMKYQETEVDFPQSLSLPGVLSADKKAFGADRSRLIRLLLRTKAAWFLGWTSDPAKTSYLLVRMYDDMREFGPWVCMEPREEEGKKMLLRALGRIGNDPVEVSCLRRNHAALSLLESEGFREIREGCRMYFGKKAHIGEDRAQYALGFLDKG